MKERLHFFDAIAVNKRNSLILMAGMLVFTVFFLWILFSLFLDFGLGLFLSVIISSVYVYFAYNNGMSLILGISDAKELERKDHPYLHHAVEGLSIAAGIPVPKTYIINDPSPNAFATGKDPEHASIAVTTGLLERLDRRELSGVIAHEVSHIANYDIRYMMVAVVVVGFIAVVSRIFSRGLLRSGGSSKKGGGLLLLVAIVMLVLAPIMSELVKLAISRQREYLADANGSRMTRDPRALVNALRKISKNKHSVKNASSVTAPLYFSDPMVGRFSGLFATHPPIEKRIERLERM